MNSRRLFSFVCFALVLDIVGVHSARALTYAAITDAELVHQADQILIGQVISLSTALQDGATHYSVIVERVLKGETDLSEVVVRVPGGPLPGGMYRAVPGLPPLTEGERVILFLKSSGDGSSGLLHLPLGVFFQAQTEDGLLAVRRMQSARKAFGSENVAPVRKRLFEPFADWLESVAKNQEEEPTYFIILEHEVNWRWTPITNDFPFWPFPPVMTWQTHQDGQSGLAGGGHAEFQVGLAAWNATNPEHTNIDLAYGGQMTSTAGFSLDGINGVLFNDPNGDVPGSATGCTGVLAVAAPVWLANDQIFEADVIVNDGAEDCGSRNFEEIAGHELGHALGLGHSNLAGALMFGDLHGDGRGAHLTSDDCEGVRFLYGDQAPCLGFGMIFFDGFENGSTDEWSAP